MLVLPLTGVFLYLRIADHVVMVFDAALYDKVQALISLTELDYEDGLEFDFADDGVMSEFDVREDAQYYQVWDQAENLLIKSPSLLEFNLPLKGVGLDEHLYADIELQDGRAGRLIEIKFLPRVEIDNEEGQVVLPEPKPISLVYARERITLDNTLFAIGITVVTIVMVVLLVTGILVWHLVGRGLLPLSTLAEQVSEINESSLSTRLRPQGEHSLEVVPIIDQLNHLLERLQSAFERERRFSSNVAHELRTPLSELKALAEVGQLIPDDKIQVTAFFEDVGDISRQMEKVVVTLLDLARSEAGLLNSDPEEIALTELCDSIWLQVTKDRRVDKKLIKHVQDDLLVSVDREMFSMILGNVLSNAISYSQTNAEIHLTAETEGDYLVLKVKNVAADLNPEDILHMKERFWRKNRSDGDAGHSGLGLTLVDALARILSLDVTLELDSSKTFMVTISGVPVTLV
jgi:two-component system sensor histidine kinase QseC